jgi:hypothetical protein
MNKLSLLAFPIILSVFAGCAMQPYEVDEDPSQQSEAAEKKGGGKKTRDERIQACKDACYPQYTPCTGTSNPFGRVQDGIGEFDLTPGYAKKGVTPACNSSLSPDLGPNPFGIAQCDEDGGKIQ